MRYKRFFHFLQLACTGVLLVALTACSKPSAPLSSGRGDGGVPVLAGEVERKDVPLIVRAIGVVHPRASVTIKPQVGGQIAQVHFKEGQELKTGDPLFTIDKRPFEVALQQAQAALDLAEAQAANAEDQSTRYKTLSKTGAVAAEQFDQIKTTLRTTAAGVKSAEAVVSNAQLQVEYCDIRSPIEGRAGKYLVDAGNVVQANQTDLVVINQIDPIEVTFAVAERYLGEIRRYAGEGQLKVVAVPDGKELQPVEGKLIFVDNAVKSATGTIALKGLFTNNPKALWPGQFVDVELWLTTDRDAVVAPAAAVQTGQDGQFVYIIKPDQTVEARKVVLARVAENDAVIREGLKGGEKIVLDGQSRLGPGSKVEVKSSLTGEVAPRPPQKPTGKPASKSDEKAALTRVP
jgi:multidrug efflux system membrane fusion protein